MNFKWDAEKNKLLKSERNVCFEDVTALIYEDKVLDIIAHPTHPKREISSSTDVYRPDTRVCTYGAIG